MERRVVETQETPVRDREVVVTNGGGGGFAGVLLAIVGIVVVLILGYFLVTSLAGSDTGGETNIDAPAVEVPDEINVDVNEGGG